MYFMRTLTGIIIYYHNYKDLAVKCSLYFSGWLVSLEVTDACQLSIL